jgi:hypothetical protein
MNNLSLALVIPTLRLAALYTDTSELNVVVWYMFMLKSLSPVVPAPLKFMPPLAISIPSLSENVPLFTKLPVSNTR